MSSDARHTLFEELTREIRLSGSLGTLYGQAVADRLAIHYTDLQTMDLLNIFGPMTAGRLSELTGLTTGATTRLIDRLEAGGYVHRSPHPFDRRKVIIEVNPEKGSECFALFAPMGDRLRSMWEQMIPEQLETILDFYRRSNEIMLEQNTRIRKETAEAD